MAVLCELLRKESLFGYKKYYLYIIVYNDNILFGYKEVLFEYCKIFKHYMVESCGQ